MADGGSFLDGARETARGIVRLTRVLPQVFQRLVHHHLHFPNPRAFAAHVWEAGHDDQRLSWFAHWLICLGATVALGAWPSGVAGNLFPAVGVAFVAWVFYMYREAADQRYHQDIAHDYDKLDHDVDWRGRKVETTTARGDHVGDLTGPSFNLGSFFAAACMGAML